MIDIIFALHGGGHFYQQYGKLFCQAMPSLKIKKIYEDLQRFARIALYKKFK